MPQADTEVRGLRRAEDGVVDEIAIERACTGERIPLTPTERLLAVEELLRRGVLLNHIAQNLHLSGTTTRRLVSQALAAREPDAA